MMTARWFGRSSRSTLERVSAQFGEFLGEASDEPATLVGAEHEFRVVTSDARARQIDFRKIIHGLDLGRRGLDPDDPFSFRLASGNAVTCDEGEAEIALAPEHVYPGSASRLAERANRESKMLESALPAGLTLRGHSTHVSVSVPREWGEAVGSLFARTFGAALIRLVDSPDRCGIWVRPRHERLELCLDYTDGARLAAVVIFCVAAVRACLGAVDGGRVDPEFAQPLRVNAGPTKHRGGWHLGRNAFFDGDPFDEVGNAPLALADGGWINAGEHLQGAWSSVRGLARENASKEELLRVDRLVAGLAVPEIELPGETTDSLPASFGDALRTRQRGSLQLAVVALTWQFAVFLLLTVDGPKERRAFAGVPRPQLNRFLNELDAGNLDGLLWSYMATRPAGRVLQGRDQIASAGLFDAIGLRRALLPVEETPRTATLTTDRQAA